MVVVVVFQQARDLGSPSLKETPRTPTPFKAVNALTACVRNRKVFHKVCAEVSPPAWWCSSNTGSGESFKEERGWPGVERCALHTRALACLEFSRTSVSLWFVRRRKMACLSTRLSRVCARGLANNNRLSFSLAVFEAH